MVSSGKRFAGHDNTGKKIVLYGQQSADVACFNAVYDMNGSKGPNQVGKDVGFVGSFYNGYEVKTVAVSPHATEESVLGSKINGKNNNWTLSLEPNYDNVKKSIKYCNKIGKDGVWTLPDINELSLIYLNKKLVNGSNDAVTNWYWSLSPICAEGFFLSVNFSDDSDSGRNDSSERKAFLRISKNDRVIP